MGLSSPSDKSTQSQYCKLWLGLSDNYIKLRERLDRHRSNLAYLKLTTGCTRTNTLEMVGDIQVYKKNHELLQ